MQNSHLYYYICARF